MLSPFNAIGKGVGLTANTVEGTGYQLANKTGYVGQKIADYGRALFGMPNETLSMIASGLQKFPKGKFLGDALQRGLETNNTQLRNAALFAMLQNPQVRDLIVEIERTNPGSQTLGGEPTPPKPKPPPTPPGANSNKQQQ